MDSQLSYFDFELPESRIALAPAMPRDHAKLLHVPAGKALNHKHVFDLPDLLRSGDVLVLNNTKVIPARLYGRRGQAKVECLLHRDLGGGLWEAFARPAKRLKL
nr:S-adenosylmethionine:tRNA ribosyltransferase-isomerase [Alphaproteobacteria bacterium]